MADAAATMAAETKRVNDFIMNAYLRVVDSQIMRKGGVYEPMVMVE